MKTKSMLRKLVPYLLLFCIWGILNEPLFEFYRRFFINPFFNKVSKDSALFIFSIIIIIATSIVYLIHLISKKIIFTFHFIAITILFSIVYLYYRVVQSEIFLPNSSYLKLTDILLIPLGIIIINYLVFKCSKKGKAMSSNTNGGFLHDEPLKEIDDEYRSGLSIKVVETLLATNNIDSSFAFAVMGEWGSGKTTFLNQIVKELKEKKHECNIIIFNPWQVEDSTSITKEFFVALADELNKMVVGLKIEVEDYASSLINDSKTGFFQSLLTKTIFLFRKENKTLADKHGNIQNAISATGKKLFIVIDDLDRLDTAEIKEVFRIIRNSASFGNVIFLVAFDFNQIDKAIGDNNVNGVKYLDKIFQASVLMNSYRKGAIRDFLIKNLQGVLSEDDLKLLTNESEVKNLAFNTLKNSLLIYGTLNDI